MLCVRRKKIQLTDQCSVKVCYRYQYYAGGKSGLAKRYKPYKIRYVIGRESYPGVAMDINKIRKKQDWLENSNFGQADAEKEQGRLSEFFVKTHAWRRLINGEVTIVHGRKGSGKSALYSNLIVNGRDNLRERNIHVVPGNHLDLIDQLPQDVPPGFNWSDFWYSYILILSAGRILQEKWNTCPEIIDYLASKQLLDNQANNQVFLSRLSQFVWETRGGLSYEEVFRRSSREASAFSVPQMSDMTISRSSHVTSHPVQTPIDVKVSWSSLLQHLHGALAKEDRTLWIALDKLDVVFSRLPRVEIEAINGLLRCHEDIGGFTHIRLRLFLQTLAFQRAKSLGLTNPDHLATAVEELQWDGNHLTRLLMHRLLSNPGVLEFLALPWRGDWFGDFKASNGRDVILNKVLNYPAKRNFVFRTIFQSPDTQSSQAILEEEKQHKAQGLLDDGSDSVEAGNEDEGFMANIMQILAVDKSEYNPRDFVTFMSHAVKKEVACLEDRTHDSYGYLISREAMDYALETIAVDKLLNLVSRYNLMTGARLQPYLRELKKLVAGGRFTQKVSETLADWTPIAGGYEEVARETLKFCYENNLFKRKLSVEDELLNKAGRQQPTLVLTPLYRIGLRKIQEKDLSDF